MAEAAGTRATYEDLCALPDHLIGQIIGGELIATPRPSPDHSFTASVMGGKLTPPYQFGDSGGPGGWIILDEPETMFGEDLLVPDLAGWRRERFPGRPEANWFSVAPDWICEVLSPGTVRTDRVRKMPVYGQHAVQYLWLVDPVHKTLEVFTLESGKWFLSAVFGESDRVRATPFHDIEIDLASLWLE
jgi:Uma2 family endonuclease